MAKLTGPSGDDEGHRNGDSPGGAADSGVASGDECPTAGRDIHQDRYSHQMVDHDNISVATPRCSAPFNSVVSSPHWMELP